MIYNADYQLLHRMKEQRVPNTLVCPHIISDFHQSFPMTFCHVPKVINTAYFPS
jgi:hypothetical protein